MVTPKQVLDAANRASRAGDMESYNELLDAYVKLVDERTVAKYGEGVEPVDDDAGIIENLRKGFVSGAVGLVETAALGGATALEEETELKAREKIKAVGDFLTPDGGDPEALSYKFASGLGSIAAFLPTALLGKAALPAAGVLAVAAGGGEASERARDYGATEEERNKAILGGALVGTTEIIPLGRLAKKLEVPFLSDALETLSTKMGANDVSTLRGKLQSAALTGTVEGAQETAAAVLQNLVEQGYNPERLLIDAGVAEEGAIGGSAGATLQAMVDLFAGRRIKKARAAAKEEEQKQTDFEERQEAAREKRGDAQGDMFADELNEAEEAELARMEEEEKAEEARKKDPDEAELARMEAEEKAEREEKDKVEDEKERAKQIDLVDRIAEEEELDRMQAEEDAEKTAQTKADEKKAEEAKARKTGILDRRRDSQVQSKTTLARRFILNKVIEEDTTGDFNVIRNNFAKALAEQGFRDTNLSRVEDTSLKTILRKRRRDAKKEEPKAGPPLPGSAVQQGQPIKTLNEEPDGVREQTDGAPVADTGRESVQGSSEGVVGRQPADTERTGEPEQRGLDSGVDSAREPARREGREQPTLERVGAKKSKKREFVSFDEFKRQRAAQPRQKEVNVRDKKPAESAIPAGKKPIITRTLPTLRRNKKIRFRETTDALDPRTNSNYKNDMFVMDGVSKIQKPKSVSKTAPTGTTQNKDLNDLRKVTEYFSKFDSPLHALTNYIHEKADPDRTQLFEGDAAGDVLKGLSGANTDAVSRWINKNLSKDMRKQIGAEVKRLRDQKNDAIRTEKKLLVESETPTTAEQKRAEEARQAEEARVAEQKRVEKEKRQKEAEEQAAVTTADTSAVAEDTKKPASKKARAAKAKKIADDNVADVLNNPESDLTIKANYEKAKIHAKNSSKPKANLKAVEQKRKDQIEGKKQVKEAIENLDRNKLLMKLENKFKGKIDRLSLERAYDLLGKKDLNKATLSEIKEAAELQAKIESDSLTIFDIDLEATEAFRQTISAKAKEFLDRGDLKGLLRQIAKDIKTPRMKAIVRALERNMGNTIITTDNTEGMRRRSINPKPGEIKYGSFFSGTNSIVINNDYPTTVHVILHEATHAATSVFINENPNNPIVKKLNGLYETMKEKGMLQNTYAAKNLREFVAEAFSNPEFRAQLAATPFDYSNNKIVSAFQRFVNYIRDIFRIFRGDLAASSGSALDATDKWIYTILTPTPDNYVHNFEDPLSIAKAVSKATNTAGARLQGPIKAIVDYILNKKPKVSAVKSLAMAMNLQSLVDMSRKLSPKLGAAAYKLLQVIENQQGLFEQYKRSVDLVHNGLKEFIKKHGDDAKSALDQIIYNENYGATIYQVDPTRPRSDYAGRTDDSGNKLDEIWDAQHRQLANLSPAARRAVLEQFTTMRELYQKQWKILRKALGIEMRSQGAKKGVNEDVVSKVASRMDKRLFSRQQMEIYFPLVREGKFKVAVTQIIKNEDGTTREEPAFFMFKNVAERDAFIRDIPDNPDVVTGSDKIFEGDIPRSVYSAAPSGSFVADILETLEKGNVPPEIQDKILSMYVNSLPETSYAKSLQKRLNRFGYIKDAKTALENKAYSLASQSAKLESAAKIRAVVNDIEAIAKEENNQNVTAVADVLVNEHARFATKGANNKGLEEYFKKANQIAFIYTLGLNFSSALVNLSQIALFAAPMMAPRYGLDNVTAAFAKAGKMVLSSKASIIEYYDINGEGQGATYTLKESIKRDIRNNSITEKEANQRIKDLESIIPLIKMAHMRGKLPTADTLQEVGINERAGFMDRMGHMSAYFFQAAERFNTQTTLISSFNLSIKQMRDKKEAKEKYFSPSRGEEIDVTNLGEAAMQELASEDALWNTQEVNSGGRLETAPALSKQGIGRVAFMYKTYGIQMYYSMLKSAGIAFNLVFKNYSKEQRAIARQQLYGVHFTALMFAGIGGVPLYGVITMLFDLMRDDDEDTADEMVRKTFGELGFKGPLSTFTGMDVAARVKLTDLLFQHNRYMRDPSIEESLLYYVGGPAFSTVKRFDRGINDIAKGEYQRALEAMIPTAGAGNALQAVRFYMDEGIMTRRGDFIYEDIGFGEIASKFLGFAPTEYTFRVEQNARDQRVTDAVRQKRSDLHKRYYLAARFSDYKDMEKVRKEMREFNQKHPTVQITSTSILRSMKSHVKTTRSMHNGVTVAPSMRYVLERSREEYDQF